MEKRIAIYGAGGFGKEVRAMLERCSDVLFAGFIDDSKYPYRHGDFDFDDVIVAIADCAVRERVVETWKLKSVPFQPILASGLTLHQTNRIGKGAVVCDGVRMTVDIVVGDFVIINLNATIGHDVVIGDYTSIMPGVNVSGSVKIGKRVFIGSGATILQGLTVADDAVIGAGAVVTRDVPPGKIVKEVPAK